MGSSNSLEVHNSPPSPVTLKTKDYQGTVKNLHPNKTNTRSLSERPAMLTRQSVGDHITDAVTGNLSLRTVSTRSRH